METAGRTEKAGNRQENTKRLKLTKRKVVPLVCSHDGGSGGDSVLNLK